MHLLDFHNENINDTSKWEKYYHNIICHSQSYSLKHLYVQIPTWRHWNDFNWKHFLRQNSFYHVICEFVTPPCDSLSILILVSCCLCKKKVPFSISTKKCSLKKNCNFVLGTWLCSWIWNRQDLSPVYLYLCALAHIKFIYKPTT